MNSAQIREALKCKYPNRFTIPSETEIRQEISALMKETFKIQDKDMPPKDEVKKKINVIKAKYRKEVMRVV